MVKKKKRELISNHDLNLNLNLKSFEQIFIRGGDDVSINGSIKITLT